MDIGGVFRKYPDVSSFHEKFRKRVQELNLNKARAAREVGLPESTLSTYLSKTDSLPRADIGIKIAKALSVPFDWLFDDNQDWPPPSPQERGGMSNFTDAQLMEEVVRRRRLAGIDFATALATNETTDWKAIADELAKVPQSQPLHPRLRAAALNMFTLKEMYTKALGRFDPTVYEAFHYDRLPTGGLDPATLSHADLLGRYLQLSKHPGFKAAEERIGERPDLQLQAAATGHIATVLLEGLWCGRITPENFAAYASGKKTLDAMLSQSITSETSSTASAAATPDITPAHRSPTTARNGEGTPNQPARVKPKRPPAATEDESKNMRKAPRSFE